MKKAIVAFLLSVTTLGMFAQDITLRRPPTKLGVDVLDAIRLRTASRAFVGRDVSVADLSTIVWAGNGLKDTPDAVSAASGAGATIAVSGDTDYVNLYVLTAQGVYRFVPGSNLLKQVSARDARSAITSENISTASFMVLFTADTTKAPPFMKGNPALFRDVANASASYGAQNIGLVAGSLKLSSIVMYNIRPEAVEAEAKLAKEEVPLFIVQVGYTK
jgi:hypothetical protein